MKFGLWNRAKLERDMDEELRFHMQSYAEDLMRQGVAEDEAMRRARVAFGGVEQRKEECRDSLGLRVWDELRGDLRSGFRVLRKSPVFTAVALISLGLGIGANTAVFTMANQFLLRSMGGVQDPASLRVFSWAQPTGPNGYVGHVWGFYRTNDAGEGTAANFPYPLWRELQQHNGAMQNIAAFKPVTRVTANINGDGEAVDTVMVTGNFYQTLGVRMEAGRPITEADDDTAAPVAVISDAYWSAQFGRSADALGRTIHLNSVSLTVVGVNAPEFHGPQTDRQPQVFFPLSLQPAVVPHGQGPVSTERDVWWLFLIGRLKQGVSDEAANAAMATAFANAVRGTTQSSAKGARLPRLVLEPGNRGFAWDQDRLKKPVSILLVVAALVLLIACANVANLLLARGTVRQREISLRLAMGASRGRVMRQILTEALILAFGGGAAGLALGYAGRNFIPGFFRESFDTNLMRTEMDWRVFGFAFGVTLVTGLLFGIIPAWRCTQSDASDALKETGRMTAGRSKMLLGRGLVVFQVALSLLLVVGAGLFVRTLVNLRNVPTGIHPERVVLFEVEPPRTRYPPEQRIRFFARVASELGSVPGVQMSTASSAPLLANSVNDDCYRPIDKPKGVPELRDPMDNWVAPNFFETFGIPILHGRTLTVADNQHAPLVAVMNQSLAKAFFPGRNAIGQRIISCDAGAKPIEIVGVSADAKYSDIREAAPPTLYLPMQQAEDLGFMTFEVKTAASLGSVLPRLKAVVRSVDKDLPMVEVRTQDEQIDALLAPERSFAILTSSFGLLALMLASIGIYGVMAYTVSRRTNEIGIRMALGAEARSVLMMVMGETSVLAGLGIVAGVLGALWLTRLVSSMLFGLKANDLATFASGAGLLLIVALAAAFLPAWRAARVDPMRALRHE